MAIDNPVSDLARSKQMDADHSWPHEVRVAVHWVDASGKISIRSEIISANQFFGEGGYGAPLDGSFLVSAIERMRREGPPKVLRKAKVKR
jgi:hypothetical protein